MSAPLKTHDLKRVALFVGGVEINGYGEDGAIEFEHLSPEAEHIAGSDGQVAISRNNDNRMVCRITVMSTSVAARLLWEQLLAQRAEGAILPRFFQMVDLNNGDVVRDEYCVFTTKPVPSKVKGVGSVVYELLLPQAGSTMEIAGNVAI